MESKYTVRNVICHTCGEWRVLPPGQLDNPCLCPLQGLQDERSKAMAYASRCPEVIGGEM